MTQQDTSAVLPVFQTMMSAASYYATMEALAGAIIDGLASVAGAAPDMPRPADMRILSQDGERYTLFRMVFTVSGVVGTFLVLHTPWGYQGVRYDEVGLVVAADADA